MRKAQYLADLVQGVLLCTECSHLDPLRHGHHVAWKRKRPTEALRSSKVSVNKESRGFSDCNGAGKNASEALLGGSRGIFSLHLSTSSCFCHSHSESLGKSLFLKPPPQPQLLCRDMGTLCDGKRRFWRGGFLVPLGLQCQKLSSPCLLVLSILHWLRWASMMNSSGFWSPSVYRPHWSDRAQATLCASSAARSALHAPQKSTAFHALAALFPT